MGINIKNEFIKRLGKPDNETYLDEYLSFCSQKTLYESEIYTESHHILPRSMFKEYKNFKKFPENLIILSYEDHKKAHILLAKAYNIPQFFRPLNYFNNIDKNSEEYKNLKKIVYAKVGKKVSEFWKSLSEEEYEEKIKSYIISNNREEFLKNASIISKRRWTNQQYREKVTGKLTKINKKIDKRIDASNKIKQKWADAKWRENMLESRAKSNLERKLKNIKRPNSQSLKEKWADPVWREKMLQARKKSK